MEPTPPSSRETLRSRTITTYFDARSKNLDADRNSGLSLRPPLLTSSGVLIKLSRMAIPLSFRPRRGSWILVPLYFCSQRMLSTRIPPQRGLRQIALLASCRSHRTSLLPSKVSFSLSVVCVRSISRATNSGALTIGTFHRGPLNSLQTLSYGRAP